jgi:hypothetical protein
MESLAIFLKLAIYVRQYVHENIQIKTHSEYELIDEVDDDEPASASRRVVLPQPDGPMMASTSPGAACPLIPLRILTGSCP